MVNTMPGLSGGPEPRLPKWAMKGSSWNSNPMPWPPKLRTTEKPAASACAWIAAPMSPAWPPGPTRATPSSRHSRVTSTSRRAGGLTSPIRYMSLASPK